MVTVKEIHTSPETLHSRGRMCLSSQNVPGRIIAPGRISTSRMALEEQSSHDLGWPHRAPTHLGEAGEKSEKFREKGCRRGPGQAKRIQRSGSLDHKDIGKGRSQWKLGHQKLVLAQDNEIKLQGSLVSGNWCRQNVMMGQTLLFSPHRHDARMLPPDTCPLQLQRLKKCQGIRGGNF